MKTRFQTRLENMGRRYYEVFGDLEAQAEFLKLMSLVLFVLLFLALMGAFVLAKRPPLVIRVDQVGKAEAIRDMESHNAVTEPEIFHFSKTFVRRYGEYNAYTISRDMAEAWNMMSSRYQDLAKRSLIESGVLAKIEESQLHSSIEFKEEAIQRRTPEHVRVELVWVRTLMSYRDPDFRQSTLLKSELVLKKVPRKLTEPSGLLVEDYREILLNRLETQP
ncbi:VirB8/TrbF family protein [Omnitrophica bacterium]|nr:VirB8/TrbF family protein [Candidatus Omnitrophota bacterium]